MITEQQSKFVQPRVFYTGLAIAVVLLVVDFLLLVRAHGTTTQIEIYSVLFTLAILSVVYRYHSSNPQLKRLGARGIWFLVLILVGAGFVFIVQPTAAPPNQPLPAAPAAPAAGPSEPDPVKAD